MSGLKETARDRFDLLKQWLERHRRHVDAWQALDALGPSPPGRIHGHLLLLWRWLQVWKTPLLAPEQDEAVDFEEGWTLGWAPNSFRILAASPEFHGVITLARLANLIRFVYSDTVEWRNQGPEGRRQVRNTFYLGGAILVEAEKTVAGVGTFFSAQADFVALQRVFHTPEFDEVVSRFRALRKRAAFHVNQEDVQAALARIASQPRDFFAFLTAYGGTNKYLYYDLADDAAMELVVGEDGYGEWLGRWMERSAAVSLEVFRALEVFIHGRIEAWNPEYKQTERDTPPDIERTRRIVREKGG